MLAFDTGNLQWPLPKLKALSVFYQNECFDSAFSKRRRHFYIGFQRKGKEYYCIEIDTSLKLILRGGNKRSELTISAAVLIMPT